MDDIIVATVDFTEHKELLRTVLDRIRRRGLTLNLSKCRFGYSRIEYLGYSVSAAGITLSESHTNDIKRYPMPTNHKELQSCLGLFSYFRRFVPSFSRIAKPLLNLLKRGMPFVFDNECVDSFKRLKSELSRAPVLSIYNPLRETELHCDASATGFGAVLLQRQDDKKMHPVAYFSKTTSAAEAKYHSFELETLAIVYALRRFRTYLEGIPFQIITDCNSLALTLERKQINARIARWALELENYNYKVLHRRGTAMRHVDALSRCVMAIDHDAGDVDFRIQVAQERDENLKEIREKLLTGKVKGFDLQDGLVCRLREDGSRLLCVPGEMEDNVIRLAHEKLGTSRSTKHAIKSVDFIGLPIYVRK